MSMSNYYFYARKNNNYVLNFYTKIKKKKPRRSYMLCSFYAQKCIAVCSQENNEKNGIVLIAFKFIQ